MSITGTIPFNCYWNELYHYNKKVIYLEISFERYPALSKTIQSTIFQPLMDNLESQTYEVFEKDPVKYNQYQEVIYRVRKM